MHNNGYKRGSEQEEPFVSVLTPVYNGEKFLSECIESVLNQTYTNWEYVLVNNQSSDGSLQVMKEYAKKDSRIRIHDNEQHLPQMKNLNHAFRQISPESKYCKVVHADDWLFPECISKMVALNEEHPSVGVVSAYRLDDNLVGLDGLPYPSHFVSGKEIVRSHFLDDTFYFGAPTSLLIRSDLIRNRDKIYVESHQGTDTGACINLLKESDFGFVHQVLTFTRRHENSVTNSEAKNTHFWIHAKLYNTLEYGPFFLTDEEYEQCLAHDIKRYYTLLARNIFETRSRKVIKRQLRILDAVGLRFEIGKFIALFVREMGLQLFKLFGARLEKQGTTEKNYPSEVSRSYKKSNNGIKNVNRIYGGNKSVEAAK